MIANNLEEAVIRVCGLFGYELTMIAEFLEVSGDDRNKGFLLCGTAIVKAALDEHSSWRRR